MKKTVLVTGGAGYIGSHTTLVLLEQGYEVVVIDNLENSSAQSLDVVEQLTGKSAKFYEADLLDKEALDEVFKENPIESVIHFAGLKAVGESVEKPLSYYQNNLISTINLLEAMAENNVYEMVFSSSATVYGDPETVPIVETQKRWTTNPYGQTKLMIEHICEDLATSESRWKISLLRYFNPVGAHESGQMGEDPNGIPNNLVPFVMQVAVGRRDELMVFGDDYDTPDGTGVRDYIHVMDLAQGHISALENISTGANAYNLGTGNGASVLDVVKKVEEVSGVKIPYKVAPRRTGDVQTLIAQPDKATKELQWQADRNLETMLRDAWEWQSKNPMGYKD